MNRRIKAKWVTLKGFREVRCVVSCYDDELAISIPDAGLIKLSLRDVANLISDEWEKRFEIKK